MMTWYTGDPTYDTVLTFAFVLVLFVFIGGALMKSPYGRFASDKWGVNLSPRLGWFLMELPAMLSFVFFYFQGRNRFELVPLFFLLVWVVHYGNRGFVFPYLIRSPKGATASFSITIVVMGWLVTTLHGYLNAAFISDLGTHFTLDWFTDPRFIIGISLYYASFVLNIRSDAIIRNLRSVEEIERGDKVYRIPRGGLFRFVTNPSYLTEITAFTGFAIATWSLGATFILLITIANLVPRAFQTHRWYREKFPDYPRERRVLIPFVL
jgi:3-oxo-5-alpha-steroid 4-dehydrogenase 1